MSGFFDRVLIAGAGPVGLCLALKLAQNGVASLVIEQLTDANFLDQVPRAGTNHPATLEMYDDIGLYKRLEPRGIVAPLFHYWDRAKGERIADEFQTLVEVASLEGYESEECIKRLKELLDHPLVGADGTRVAHFTRVETFGTPDHHWVEAIVDYDNPQVFSFFPRYVEENR